MHVALIIDEERLEQEQSMLNRLCIGLMAEGVHVTRIVPDRALPDVIGQGEQRVALARRIETSMHVLPWMRRSRLSKITESLDRNVPDVFYAIGERAWHVGLDLAEGLERPLLIDVCSTRQARLAPGPDRSNTIVGYVACTPPLAETMSARVGHDLVNLVPIGVSVTAKTRHVLAEPAEAALAVLGGSRDLRGYDALFGGLSELAKEYADLQIFLELHGPHEHEIWKRADRCGLLKQISAIGHAPLYRSLMTRCDVLLIAEALGVVRSIVLEAMALGIPVIARRDEALDILIDGETAMIVEQPDASAWVKCVRDAIVNPAECRAMGMRGRAAVGEQHGSSFQVSRLLEVLERAPGGGAIKLQPQAS